MKSVILLHGALGSAEQIKELEWALSPHYNVICFDMKGHGKKCDGSGFTIQSLVDDLNNYMQQQAIDSACFFGYSMGGYVALQMAVQHPSKVEQVLTLGTKLRW